MSFDNIPNEWRLPAIGEVCEINPKIKVDDEADVGFMPMSDMPTEYRGKLKFEVKKWHEVKKGYTQFQNGDTLFAKITPCFENGKAGIVRGFPSGVGAGSTEYFVLRPIAQAVVPELLLALVKTKEFLTGGETNMTGSVGHKRVPKEYVENHSLPLPPLAEQEQIAAKLDELLAQVDTIKARLDSIPHILKHFRQSVLAAAVSGKLTEEWKKHNCVNDWVHTNLDSLCESSFYGPRFSKEDYSRSGVPTIRTTDMTENGLIELTSDTPLVQVPKEKLEQFRVKKGDLLVTRTGSIGVMAIFDGDYFAIPSAYLIRFRFKESVEVKYAYYFLTSPIGQQELGLGITAITQPNINAKTIRAIGLDLPSLQEQTEIVRRVEQLFAYADQIEQRVKDAQARVNHLTQSILAKAFRGELTADWRAQNPDLISGDNSAEALLARIRAERESAAGKPKIRKRKERA